MKKIVLVLFAALLLVGCGDKKVEAYDLPDGDMVTIDLIDVAVDMSGYQGFTDKDHNYRRVSIKEVFRLVEEGATGVVYFGYTSCPYCQRVVPVLNEVAKEYNHTVYYVDVYNEVDKVTDVDVEKYFELFDGFLETDSDGNPQFLVPQVFFIYNGKVIAGNTGVVDSFSTSQTDLTKDQKEELTNIFAKMFASIASKQ